MQAWRCKRLTRPVESFCLRGRWLYRRCAKHQLALQPRNQRADQIADRHLPIMVAGVTLEITHAVMDMSSDIKAFAVPGKREVKDEVTQALPELLRSAKPGHELLAMRRLQQDVPRIELNHYANSFVERGGPGLAAIIVPIHRRAR